jgi:hypothetical protein
MRSLFLIAHAHKRTRTSTHRQGIKIFAGLEDGFSNGQVMLPKTLAPAGCFRVRLKTLLVFRNFTIQPKVRVSIGTNLMTFPKALVDVWADNNEG